jgi:hypothetical protein
LTVWLQTVILLISASWVARITGMKDMHLGFLLLFAGGDLPCFGVYPLNTRPKQSSYLSLPSNCDYRFCHCFCLQLSNNSDCTKIDVAIRAWGGG